MKTSVLLWLYKRSEPKHQYIPKNLNNVQVANFCNLACFDKTLFDKHYPDMPKFREFVLNHFLNVLDSDKGHSIPTPEKNNESLEFREKYSNASKLLFEAVKIINTLPDNLKNLGAENGTERQLTIADIDTYANAIRNQAVALANNKKTDVFLDKLFRLFDGGTGIPEFEDITTRHTIEGICNRYIIADIAHIILNREEEKSTKTLIKNYVKHRGYKS